VELDAAPGSRREKPPSFLSSEEEEDERWQRRVEDRTSIGRKVEKSWSWSCALRYVLHVQDLPCFMFVGRISLVDRVHPVLVYIFRSSQKKNIFFKMGAEPQPQFLIGSTCI
jgi:hypothetical protein